MYSNGEGVASDYTKPSKKSGAERRRELMLDILFKKMKK